MFKHVETVHMKDTDATGVLYFPHQFRMAQETFATYLKRSGFSWGKLLNSGDYLLPVVHAEGDYSAPLFMGDEIELSMRASRIGTSSFTLEFQLISNHKEVGKVSLVHVTVARETRTSIPIPEDLRQLLNRINKTI